MDDSIPPEVSKWLAAKWCDCEVFGDVLRELRESRNLTQRALAKLVFMSDKAISRIETGQQFLKQVDDLTPFVSALKCSSDEHNRLVYALFCTRTNDFFGGRYEEIQKWLSQQKLS